MDRFTFAKVVKTVFLERSQQQEFLPPISYHLIVNSKGSFNK